LNIKNKLIQDIDFLLSTSDKVNIYNRNLLLIENKDNNKRFEQEIYFNNDLVMVIRYSGFATIDLKTCNRYIIKDFLDCLKECVKYEEDRENNNLKILEEEYNK
jgi:hypothetical protein